MFPKIPFIPASWQPMEKIVVGCVVAVAAYFAKIGHGDMQNAIMAFAPMFAAYHWPSKK